MKTSDYENLGAEHARNGDKRRYSVMEDSWQAKAYWRGVNSVLTRPVTVEAEAKVIGEATEISPIVATFSARGGGKSTLALMVAAHNVRNSNWPTGAKEHAIRLLDDLANEKHAARRARLNRALVRMQKRHGSPITTN